MRRIALGLLGAGFLAACGGERPPLVREAVEHFGVPDEVDAIREGRRGVELGTAAAPVGPAPARVAADEPPRGPRTPARPARRPAARYREVEVSGGGIIRGRVAFPSAPRAIRPVPITKDQEGCRHTEHPSERVVYDPQTLGVQNCVVYLVEIAEGKAWAGDMAKDERSALLDQVHCVYVPHVMVVRKDTQLAVRNSDPVEHNIHGYRGSMLTTQFNFFTSAHQTLDRAGTAFLEQPAKYIVKCDIHPWMNAYVHAVLHPYHAVTGPDGTFVLEDVPPGDWQVGCWHEGMREDPVFGSDGEITAYRYSEDVELPPQQVTVPPGGTVEVEFQLPLP
jgi:plastocyanin